MKDTQRQVRPAFSQVRAFAANFTPVGKEAKDKRAVALREPELARDGLLLRLLPSSHATENAASIAAERRL
jgi:hypothetical protein